MVEKSRGLFFWEIVGSFLSTGSIVYVYLKYLSEIQAVQFSFVVSIHSVLYRTGLLLNYRVFMFCGSAETVPGILILPSGLRKYLGRYRSV